MKQIIINIIAVLLLSIVPATTILGSASAATKPLKNPDGSTACPADTTSGGQVLIGIGQTGNKCNDNKVEDTIAAVVRILGYIVGIVAVIMIIVSGFKYITSAGDAAKVSSAKSTLIYAAVGLAIAALAQLIVQFVISTSINT